MKKHKILLTSILISLLAISATISGCGFLDIAGESQSSTDSTYFESSTQNESQASATLSQATDIANTLPSTSDYDYIKAAHDWIITNTSYDTTQPVSSIPSSSFSPSGVFVEHLAVCQGYALAYEALMDVRGIDCKVVYGQAGGISHAWNIVKLDGNWYHVDTTWDDPLIGGINGSGTSNLSYDYFLMPDSVILQNHTISYVIDNNNTRDKETAPECISDKYLFSPKSYGVNASEILNSINDMPEVYYRILHGGNPSVTFFFPESESYSDSIISDLQYYVASKDGSCSGFSINVSDTTFSGYKYITLIAK